MRSLTYSGCSDRVPLSVGVIDQPVVSARKTLSDMAGWFRCRGGRPDHRLRLCRAMASHASRGSQIPTVSAIPSPKMRGNLKGKRSGWG